MKTVTFFGHSKPFFEKTQAIKAKLIDEIKNLIKQGADTFLLGSYGAFDTLCAKTVKDLQYQSAMNIWRRAQTLLLAT